MGIPYPDLLFWGGGLDWSRVYSADMLHSLGPSGSKILFKQEVQSILATNNSSRRPTTNQGPPNARFTVGTKHCPSLRHCCEAYTLTNTSHGSGKWSLSSHNCSVKDHAGIRCWEMDFQILCSGRGTSYPWQCGRHVEPFCRMAESFEVCLGIWEFGWDSVTLGNLGG